MAEAKQIPMNSEPTIHSLLAELKEVIAKEVKEMAFVERPLDAAGISSFLGIHENTLYRWIREGYIPSPLIHRVRGSVFFFPSELRDFIKKS